MQQQLPGTRPNPSSTGGREAQTARTIGPTQQHPIGMIPSHPGAGGRVVHASSSMGPMQQHMPGTNPSAGSGGSTAASNSWQRPWETMRDRATYAMGFASAFVTDAFIDLSHIFLHAVNNGEVENPPAYCADGTIRLDDVYHLHKIVQGAHARLAQKTGALSQRTRTIVQHSLGVCTVISVVTLIVVHLAFVAPSLQIGAAQALSQAVFEAGAWSEAADVTCNSSALLLATTSAELTVVRLEVLNASWPQRWLTPQILWLQKASLALRGRPESDEENKSADVEDISGAINQSATGVSQNLGSYLLPRVSDMAAWAWDIAFPTPTYEVMYGAPGSAWLEVQSPRVRQALGIRTVELQVSAHDPALFGPAWTRELLSFLRLYDLYIVHALPLKFEQSFAYSNGSRLNSSSSSVTLYASVAGSVPRSVDLASTRDFAAKAANIGLPRLLLFGQRALAAGGALAIAIVLALLLSAYLRRFAILTIRMQVYSSYTVRQMRRYAFIAEPLRRLNHYSPGELLELWTAWVACFGLALWLFAKALSSSGAWVVALFCYALAEYWGIVHVRTLQSRWLYPRAMLLLQSGVLVYATWWPYGPAWILVWSQLSAQLWLMCTLLCNFDCYATLPEQAPHRLLYRSLLLPAAPLVCDKSAASLGVASESSGKASVEASQERQGQSESSHMLHGQRRTVEQHRILKSMVSRGTQTDPVDDPGGSEGEANLRGPRCEPGMIAL